MPGRTEESLRRKIERQNGILAYIKANGTQDIAALAKRFNVSEVTIRMDVRTLSAQGFLLHRFGSAEISDLHLVIKACNNYMQLPHGCRDEDKLKAGNRLAQAVRRYIETLK